MMKLLLGRLLPAGAAIGLLSSALSPLRPALDAFGVAANALAGDQSAGGAAGLGDGLQVPSPSEGVGIDGFFKSLFSPGRKNDTARRKIEVLLQEKQPEKKDKKKKPKKTAATSDRS